MEDLIPQEKQIKSQGLQKVDDQTVVIPLGKKCIQL